MSYVVKAVFFASILVSSSIASMYSPENPFNRITDNSVAFGYSNVTNDNNRLSVPSGGYVTIPRPVDEHGNKINVTYAAGEKGIGGIIHPASLLTYPPPLKQMKQGIPFSEIKCNHDFNFLMKITNYKIQPICVKLSSMPRLEKQGWMTLEKFDSTIVRPPP